MPDQALIAPQLRSRLFHLLLQGRVSFRQTAAVVSDLLDFPTSPQRLTWFYFARSPHYFTTTKIFRNCDRRRYSISQLNVKQGD